MLLLLALLLHGCEKPSESSLTSTATALERSAEKGPVKLSLSIKPEKPRLSDLVEMTLSVEAENGVEIIPPFFGEAVGEFVIRNFREPQIQPDPAATKLVRKYIYQLEPMQAGKHLIGSLGIDFIDRRENSEVRDKKNSLELEPLELEVISEFSDGAPDLTRLRPMKDPLPLPGTIERLGLWMLGGLTLLLLLAATLYLRRRKKVVISLPQRSPEEIAFEALKRLMEANLPQQGQIVEFYVQLTLIVRDYIERITGIRAPEQTTEEFLRAMRGDKRFKTEKAQQLARFLEAADLVKYAAMRPQVSDIEEAFNRAQEFVGVKGEERLIERSSIQNKAGA
jgi:hypothetical protein